ncbi:MAG: hypothetical protein IPH07_00370 [Deltaproteobacteria bacterium]|jgi:hypothetical protein|nr:hypothetical protein [Deltaproteobacteria bacterium]MBK8238545.1 hypothetical protein [Deltaproteobacteria bacterium]MBK8717373.1 hypothetical protein [Deltaproteobacteria bacterium]MBP7286238.1 hypothetical protein [Nannocystaceae bacterium]
MKRTDQERIERELKRREKHAKLVKPNGEGGEAAPAAARGVSDYVRTLVTLLQFDEEQIYNTRDDEDVFALLLEMKSELAEKHWETVLKSAIQKTKVAQKEQALTELKALITD